MRGSSWITIVVSILGAVLAGTGGRAVAQGASIGPVTKRELPRFASLRKESVNLREGPSDKHAPRFIYQRQGLPVEIVAEFENWRRIRDSEGTEGWVWHSLLSGKRTAVVVAKDKTQTVPVHATASPDAGLMARLEVGVVAQVKQCDGAWCRVAGQGFEGWIRQERLWGVYPQEKVKD